MLSVALDALKLENGLSIEKINDLAIINFFHLTDKMFPVFFYSYSFLVCEGNISLT